MRFTIALSSFIGAGLVAATPVLERKDENTIISRDIKVVYENCDVITPKVFIISMVWLTSSQSIEPNPSN
jgi:tRNA threonylcarbamoyladenosine modification (KEOPS) complex Cgi121 subunit